MIMSVLFLAFNVFAMSNPSSILETALGKYAHSTFDLVQLDKTTRGFLDMSMIKPLWEGLWAVIFGIFIALKLKKMRIYAWTLGIFWGIMMIFNGIIQGGYELVILGWSKVCLQTYAFILLGLISIGSLYFKKKEFYA